MANITGRFTHHPIHGRLELLRPLYRLSRAGMALIGKWFRNHGTRRQLANLPDWLLKDIGVKRHEALREAYKPFWKD